MDMKDFYRQARRAAVWGVGLSVGLGVLKLAGGVFGHSEALVSDAVHSFGDALTSIAVWGSLLSAQRPADREHPYGHTRAEAVAGSNVALLLVLSGLGIGWEAADHPGRTVRRAGVVHPGHRRRQHRAEGSAVPLREPRRPRHRLRRRAGGGLGPPPRRDRLAGRARRPGRVVLGRAGLDAADKVAALAVALVVLWAGGSLLWGSVQELMDRQADPEVLDEVRREAEAVPGVLGVEKLFVRKTGLEYLVDIHVEVDPEVSVREGHGVGHAVKARLMKQLVTIKDVLVHIEPSPRSGRRVGAGHSLPR